MTATETFWQDFFRRRLPPTTIDERVMTREDIIGAIKSYLRDQHCTLWQSWIITDERGLTAAADWIYDLLVDLSGIFQR